MRLKVYEKEVSSITVLHFYALILSTAQMVLALGYQYHIPKRE